MMFQNGSKMKFQIFKKIKWSQNIFSESHKAEFINALPSWFEFQIIDDKVLFWQKEVSNSVWLLNDKQTIHLFTSQKISQSESINNCCLTFKNHVFVVSSIQQDGRSIPILSVFNLQGKIIYEENLRLSTLAGYEDFKILKIFYTHDKLYLTSKAKSYQDGNQVILIFELQDNFDLRLLVKCNTLVENIAINSQGVLILQVLEEKPYSWFYQNLTDGTSKILNYPYPQKKITIPFPTPEGQPQEFLEDFIFVNTLILDNNLNLSMISHFVQSLYINDHTCLNFDVKNISTHNLLGGIKQKGQFINLVINEQNIYTLYEIDPITKQELLIEKYSLGNETQKIKAKMPNNFLDYDFLDISEGLCITLLDVDRAERLYVSISSSYKQMVMVFDSSGNFLEQKSFHEYSNLHKTLVQPISTWQITVDGDILVPVQKAETFYLLKIVF